MGKTILVTGALGAVGSYLVPELRSRGHEVHTVDLHHHHDPLYTRCDVSEFRQVERLWTGGGWENGYNSSATHYDLVYHLAAEFGRWNGEDYYERLWNTNAVGTKNILRMQEKEGFRAIYFSSSEVYGDYEGIISEEVMEREFRRQMNDYAISKWVNELQVLNSAEQYGTKSVRVRLFNTYGPGEYYSPYRSVICLFCYRLLNDLPITVYRGYRRTSTYITDMARTLANIADSFRPGEVYNIGGDEYHSVERVVEIILRCLGKDSKRGELVSEKEQEVMTSRDKRVDCTKAREHLKHESTISLEEGIRKTLAWMKDVYGISNDLPPPQRNSGEGR